MPIPICPQSPLKPERVLPFLKEHLDLNITEKDLRLMLAIICAMDMDALRRGFGLRMEVQNPLICWLLRQEDTAGVALKLHNTPRGIQIHRLTSLGGGEHCTGLEA